jgi:hypothetical protein
MNGMRRKKFIAGQSFIECPLRTLSPGFRSHHRHSMPLAKPKGYAGEEPRTTRVVGTLMDSGFRPAMTSASSRTISSLMRSSG